MGIAYSKITSKSQTVIPTEVRKQLGVKPGDRLRYEISDKGVVMSKGSQAAAVSLFAVFTEWAGAADEEAYGKL